MYALATVVAILALATTAFANPVNIKLDKRDPNNFRLYQVHRFQNQCIPGTTCVPVNNLYVTVHDDCNGGGCEGEQSSALNAGESFCDKDISVCDRTLQLVSRGEGDCKSLNDLFLGDGNDGKAYATLVEGGNRVGACEVDFSNTYSKKCGGGTFNFQSQVFCHFD